MFLKNANRALRRKKTRNNVNLSRKEFIETLVNEYHTTTNIEAQEQVTANLVNFAYDPLNYQYLRDAAALQLFFQLISLPNERLALHGVAGICNICSDFISRQEIIKPKNIEAIFKIFKETTNTETLIYLLTIFYLLALEDNSVRLKICSSENVQRITLCTKSTEQRLKLLAIVFLKDFASTELVTNDRKLLACRTYSSFKDSIIVHKIFTQDDLDKFTKLTGDTNPIHSTHVPEEERMVHGALLNGVVSGIIGTHLPGPGTVVLFQELLFPRQCRINKNTEILVKLVSKRKISVIYYECRQENEIVFKGKAKVMLPKNKYE
ncbi:LOW QUALITY PROTEIN: armadillo repeat-containing protein 7 [Eupeodes corollae]|uniref:LOW QUALITY PROTEIN: armadillo repeat-containing protein 7 n=1 Tax=Eupeodes corollae TaxID=290404 RepID=UPI002491B246|nr:LOW QUALITY PROTEIN: armadillo repeat-containing protein 7 [Eupeodes corollae]